MRKLFFLATLILFSYYSFSQQLILNEIVAKNANSYINNQGSSPDWIEIKNISNSAIQLSDYSLATKECLNTPWQFPDKKLAAGAVSLFEAKESKTTAQWETVIDLGHSFTFTVPSYEISNWYKEDYNVSEWNNGPSPIGFGESNIASSVPAGTKSVFLRTTFSVSDINDITDLMLHMDCDDGFIAYINGKEVVRFNMNQTAYNAFANNATEGVIANGGIPEKYTIENPQNILHEGINTFCVQVHNCNATSSDLLAIPILSIGYNTYKDYRGGTSKYCSFSSGNIFPHSLDASSDIVYLLYNNNIVDSISWKDIPVDISIGRKSGDNTNIYYFQKPTPKKQNGDDVFVAETLEKPKLSVPGSVITIDETFYVSAYSSETDVTIRYTTDGSVPTEKSKVFPEKLLISTTTNLRVRAFRNGYLPSKTTTNSYLYLNRNQNLPIASITVKKGDFFSNSEGIYMLGYNASKEEPYYGANYWQDWEKPIHFEYFDENGDCVVSQDAGVKIGGNWSRAQPQKTLKIYARDEYGKDEMEYQFFKDKPISSFHLILLRNSGNDFNNTQMRDGVISELAKQMDIDRQAYQPAIVFINGNYYGIQNVREKQNKHYVAENYGYDKDDIDVIKNNGEVADGNNTDYFIMRNFMENNDLSNEQNYEQAKKYIDIQNFIDYNILEMYVVNEDWPGNNIAYWHSRSGNTPWRYMLFDADFGLGIWDVETKVNKNMFQWCTLANSSNYATAPWSTIILRQLLQNADFKRDFLNSLADRLNTTLSAYSINHTIDSVYDIIEDEMVFHKERWGDNWQDGWLNQMKDFGNRRDDIMRRQAENFFSTNGSYKLTISSSEKNAGVIQLNSITVSTFPWSGKYFNNNTISLTAIAKPGYKFIRWEGAVNSTEKSITITTNQATSITAVYEYIGNEPNIQFTEVYYHTYQDDETKWIELYNKNNAQPILDISNWTITLDRYNQTFTFPEGSKLGTDEHPNILIIAKNKERFCEKYPTIPAESVIGNIDIDFPKDFATVTLRNVDGCKMAEMYYTDQAAYAQKADGYGYSYAYFDKKWYAYALGGDPLFFSENNSVPAVPTLRPVITEINFAPSKTLDSGDWIEIYNPDEYTAFNLKDWMIQDDGGKISVIYDDITIAPGEYIVFANNPEKFNSIYPDVKCYQLDLSLNNYQDGITVYNEYEKTIDFVSYSMFEDEWSKNTFKTGRTLSLRDYKSDNALGKNWSASKSYGTPGAPNDYILTTIEETNEMQVSVFPNPCSDHLQIECEGKFIYEVVSSNGVEHIFGEAINQTQVQINNLPTGIYFIIINRDGQATIKKILKE